MVTQSPNLQPELSGGIYGYKDMISLLCIQKEVTTLPTSSPGTRTRNYGRGLCTFPLYTRSAKGYDTVEATAVNPTLQQLAEIIQGEMKDQTNPDWNEVDQVQLDSLLKVKDELTVNSAANLILRGSRIVIPTALQQRATSLAHEGHQGIVKTKKLLREKVWFPGIDQKVAQMIEGCIACQANGRENCPQPLQMSTLPPAPWHTVHVDFCGPFPTGEYLFVVIDAYSRFPEVEVVHSTAAKTTLPKLDRIFATHGIPSVLKSDNGPPFFGEDFKAYMKENGIAHQRITPLWPQVNSEAENFMKPLTKAVRAAHSEGRDWKKDLYRFLLNYRATPHSTTGIAPSQLLFGRTIKTKLPQLESEKHTEFDQEVKRRDELAKEKMKCYADKKARAQLTEMRVGDTVLIRQRKNNKFTTKFDISPFQVVRVKGTMVTAVRNEKYVTRNISHFKKVPATCGDVIPEDEDGDYEEDEEDDDDPEENEVLKVRHNRKVTYKQP